jgi:segregation and condensation protein A
LFAACANPDVPDLISDADAPVVAGSTADAAAAAPVVGDGKFRLRLSNFEGPFDLLLTLIGKRQMDVTEVALSQVTDDFIAYITAAGSDWDLGEATEFLVIAATLLDLKAARLLPAAEVEDEEDLALLEARDLLFARLLQYRAYRQVAAYLAELERTQSKRFGRDVSIEPRFAELLPDVFLGVDLATFALIAARAVAPRPVPTVNFEHVHAARVSVAEHMAIMRGRIRAIGTTTFRSLIEDCGATIEVVARFLGLLELYRDGDVAFDQAAALSELRIRWTGPDNDTAEPPDGDTESDGDRVPEVGADGMVGIDPVMSGVVGARPTTGDDGRVDDHALVGKEPVAGERNVDEEYG